MEIVIGVIGLVVGFGIGFAVSAAGRGSIQERERANARQEIEGELDLLVRELAQGRLPDGDGSSSAARKLVEALEVGWAPRSAERRSALVDAVGRVSRFLDRQVRAPLSAASERADAAELRERIDAALGALEDVDFFLTESVDDAEGTDLVALAQQVSREFAADHDVTIRLSLGSPAIRATVAKDALMDAFYLILHNAVRFGGGGTVDMTVLQENGKSLIRIRDRGEGFSEEAFKRAFDPFYSESEEGLGLGLPHARKVLEAMGGSIELQNVPDGGAEVEVVLPA